MAGLAAFGLGLVVVGVPTVARAQPPARGGQRAETWVLSLGAQEGWEMNIRNSSSTQGQDDTVTRFVGGLSHAHQGPRLTLDLAADGAANLYRVNTALNRFNYSGSVGLGYRLSSKTAFALRDSLVSTYTTDLVGFDDEGQILELTLVRRNRAVGSLRHQVSTRTNLTLSGRHDYVDFQSETAIDGKRYGGGLDLSRRFGENTTWTLGANVSRSERLGTAADVGTANLGWRHTFTREWTAGAAAGISRIHSGDQDRTRWNAEADVSRRVERSTLSAGYARRVGQAFGLGRERESDVYRLGYDRLLGTKFAFSGDFAYIVSRDPFDSTFNLKTQNYTAGLSWNLAREWGLRGSYLFRRRSGSTGPGVDGQRALLALSYRKAWR